MGFFAAVIKEVLPFENHLSTKSGSVKYHKQKVYFMIFATPVAVLALGQSFCNDLYSVVLSFKIFKVNISINNAKEKLRN